MKIYYVILDGAADRPIACLGGKTPLETARKSYLDSLARDGELTNIQILPMNLAPESDSGVMALLGYDPLKYYCGRGSLESIGIHESEKYNYMAGFRVNFASLVKDGVFLDRRVARGLSDDELMKLTELIQKEIEFPEFPQVRWKLFTFGSYRGILSFYSNTVKLSGNVSNTDPGFQKVGYFSVPQRNYQPVVQECVPLDETEGARNTAQLINSFSEQCKKILAYADVNVMRREKNEIQANCILVRDGGGKPFPMKSFREKYQKSCTIYGQLPCEKALAQLIGGKFKYTEALKLKLSRTYLKKLADVLVNDDSDVVFCHLKGPDEPGHDGKPHDKVKAIELIDACFFEKLVLKRKKEDVIIVTCDHATPCELGIHSSDRVPLLISGNQIRADHVNQFDEKHADMGACPVDKATDIMKYVMEKTHV